MSELSKLQKWALWSTIISCFIGVLAFLIAAFTYMGVNPFMNEANQEETVIQSENVETNKDEVATLNDNIESNKESSIDNNLVENTKDNDIINLETAKDLTLWEFLLIPFKKHEKCYYINVDNELFGFIVLLFVYITFWGIFWLVISIVESLFKPTISDIIFWFIYILILLYMGYSSLVYWGLI